MKQLASTLPPVAFVYSTRTEQVCKIYAGDSVLYGFSGRSSADTLNRSAGVTPAQAAAMMAGVSYGWDDPRANPENYSPAGVYRTNKSNAREGA